MKLAKNSNLIEIDENSQMHLSSLNVERAGSKLKVALIQIGPEEGLVINQAAELFDVSVSTVLKHIARHAITYGLIVRKSLQVLKIAGVIQPNTAKVVFIPRKGLRDLLPYIGTDAARAAYHQLFDDAEELYRIKPLYDAQEQLLKEKDQKIAKIEGEKHDLRKSNEDLKATVDAFERHIKGKPTKKRNYEIIVSTERRTNMYGERDDVLHVEKKPLEDMSVSEKKGWCAQHTTKVGRGMIKKAASFYENSQDSNVRSAARGACFSVDNFYETLWPEAARVETAEKE